MKPKVSVCMIAYKHEAYVGQAIESILAQEADFSFELVIGDDCSPDRTAAICEEFARRDPRVRLLPRERNLGVMPNFTRTLLACQGEYVAVCEGDDYWTDVSKLRQQVALLEAHPELGGSAHQATVITEGQPSRPFREGVPELIGTHDLIGGRLFHTASVMFRRRAVDIFSGAPLVLSCDRLLNFCISFVGTIHYSPKAMCAYRLHAGGMSSNATVAQMALDLSCIPYLKKVDPGFPAVRYRSYVYATIGLCRSATFAQKLRFLGLSFLCSFADFPRNLGFFGSRLVRFVRTRLRAG